MTVEGNQAKICTTMLKTSVDEKCLVLYLLKLTRNVLNEKYGFDLEMTIDSWK